MICSAWSLVALRRRLQLSSISHPEDRPRQAEIEHIIGEAAASIRRQFRVIQPGGRIISILCQIMVLATPEGESDKALGVCADVTALEDELKPLRTADERYRTLITRAKGAIFWAARADGQVYEIPSWKKHENRANGQRSSVAVD